MFSTCSIIHSGFFCVCALLSSLYDHAQFTSFWLRVLVSRMKPYTLCTHDCICYTIECMYGIYNRAYVHAYITHSLETATAYPD